MYTVLLVEDEEMIRNAIKKVIPWKELGFQLVGEMENGKETIAFLENQNVDLIITDICMPFIDGLELTNYIRNKDMKTKIVIITGHDDFEYAKQALSLGVSDYILKPVTAKEFSEVLIKIKNQLDEEKRRIEYFKSLQQKYKRTIKAAQEVFLKELLCKEIGEEIIEKRLEELSLSFHGEAYQVAAFKLGDNLVKSKLYTGDDLDIPILNFAVCNVVQEVINRYSHLWKTVHIGNSVFAIIFVQIFEGDMDFEGEVIDCLNSIIKNLEAFLGIKISIGLGRKESSILKVNLSYKEALELIEYQVILGSGKIIDKFQLKEGPESIQEEILPLFQSLEYNLKLKTEKEVNNDLEEIFKVLSNRPIKISYFKSILLKLFTCIINTSDEIIYDKDKKMEMEVGWIDKVFSKSKLEDILNDYKNLCYEILSRVSLGQQCESKEKIKQACLYIEENFYNPDLCVQELCDFLYVSSSYFSKAFKQITGKTFLEYLNDVRLEESIKLLTYTNLHSYEIAYKCGFKDPQYFSQWFKGKTNLTPKQYRNKVLVDENKHQIYKANIN